MADRHEQVCLAQPARPVDKQRVVDLVFLVLGDRLAGRVGKFVRAADNKGVEGEFVVCLLIGFFELLKVFGLLEVAVEIRAGGVGVFDVI